MRKTSLRLLPLCLAIAGAVRAEETPKPTWELCQSPSTIPWFTEVPPTDVVRMSAPTDVSADTLDVLKTESTVFAGKVELTHGDQLLQTDKITYTHETEQFVTEGPVRYQDRSVRLTAESASGDQKADELRMGNVVYQFNDELGNGVAESALMKGQVGTLTSATYSTCPPGQREWEFSARKISVNDATATGVAHNVTLRLGGIPVIWLPVVSFPTDDKRRTGVLAPTLGRDDKNGFDFKLPVYLNLAPNYDATLTPHWYSKRGLMMEGEFRYLTGRSRGRFEGTYLAGDDLFDPLQPGREEDRSLLGFLDQTTLNRHWFALTNLNYVSDRYYLSDFGDSIDATSISLLNSSAGMYGRGKYWSASLTAESWQIATPLLLDGDEPYRRLPRLQASGMRPLSRWVEAGLDFEIVRFGHESLDARPGRYSGGNRLDVRPYVRFPLGGAAWFITPQLAWRHTSYDSLEGFPVDNGAADSHSRSLPITSIDAGVFFEKAFDWGGRNYVQTLEPRLYYLHVPYRDQSELPVFDTGELTFGWTSLFRDNRFGGADRQSDANQVALALTTRILSADTGREKLSASLGRISYFDPPRVEIDNNPLRPEPSDDGSAWIANLDLALNDWWTVGATQQWNPDNERTELSSLRTQLRLRQGTIVNAAYRYRRQSFSTPGLEQTDLSFVIPVNSTWNLYGRWNYSLRDDQTIEALGGFEWNSCCVSVRVLGRQYIRSFDSRQNLGLYLEIELNGLGSFGRDTARLLHNAILGYAR